LNELNELSARKSVDVNNNYSAIYDNLNKKTTIDKDLANKSSRLDNKDESCNVIDSSRSFVKFDDSQTQAPQLNNIPKLFDDSISKKESRIDSMIDELET